MNYTYSEKVVLVSKNVEEDYLPTYVVKFDNKQQLENAIDWSTYYDYGRYDEVTKSYPNKKVIEPLINTFDNKGFKLSLLECANNSSQGGKLSFWNCIVEKDNMKFKIGINTTLLLDLLKESTFVNGVCQQPVCFVNRSGQTGMCVEDGNIYNEVKKSEQDKLNIRQTATYKYSFGNKVVSNNLTQIYLGKFYQYYTCNLLPRYLYSTEKDEYVIRKLAKPKPIYLYIDYNDYKNVDDLFSNTWKLTENNSQVKRKVEDSSNLISCSEKEFQDKVNNHFQLDKIDFSNVCDVTEILCSNLFGIGTNFECVHSIVERLICLPYVYYEEESKQ